MSWKYTNLTLRGVTEEQVSQALRRGGMRAAIVAAKREVVVYLPYDDYLQTGNRADALVRALGGDGLFVLNFSDGLLVFAIYQAGTPVGRWVWPDRPREVLQAQLESALDWDAACFEWFRVGEPAEFLAALLQVAKKRTSKRALAKVLQGPCLNGWEGHRHIVRAIGLTEVAAANSYEHIRQGVFSPEGVRPKLIS